jgi:hypothetical protein
MVRVVSLSKTKFLFEVDSIREMIFEEDYDKDFASVPG